MPDVVFLAGLAIGLLTGMVPGIHPNLVISVMGSMGIGGERLAELIIALYPASLIASFIPSIFFGIPDQGTVAAVLPGQRLTREGKGLVALRAVLVSALAAVFLSAALAYPLLWAFPLIYPAIRGWMGWILLAMCAALSLRSRGPLRYAACLLASGALGSLSFRSGMDDPFLPLFSGMFAIASIAAYRKGSVPAQADARPDSPLLVYSAAGTALGAVAVLIPGIGSSAQMASLLSLFVRMETLPFMAAMSAISVSQAILALVASASIGKERVGAVAMLAEQADIGAELPLLIGLCALSVALSACAVFALRRYASLAAAADFSILNPALAAYIAAICLIIDGVMGLAVLAAASALGILAERLEVERTSLMGAVIVPTILLLLRIFI